MEKQKMGFLTSIAITLLFLSGGRVMAHCQRSEQATFTAKDGIFRVVYPRSFRFVDYKKIDADKPESPLCQDAALLCVTYPEDKYASTTFEAAGFEINVVPSKTTESCLTPPSYPD